MVFGSKLNPGKLLRSGFVHNVIALYGVQACTYALPLLTFPYLAHVLGPSGWGVVIFAQAIGVVIASVVEYGFDISASRETSRQRNDPQRLSALISGVLGAKSLLAMVCIAGALFSRRFTHHVAPSLALFWSSTIWGVCQGINMLWFFQGLERMRLASALEIGGKVMATLSIFVLVHKPDDGWKVMAAQCVGCVVAHGVTVVLAYREVGFRWPTPSSMWDALRLGGSMFLFRAVQGLSGSVNRLVLGSVAPVAVLGEYAGAEKITRVFQQGMWPVNQALYPKTDAAGAEQSQGCFENGTAQFAFSRRLGCCSSAWPSSSELRCWYDWRWGQTSTKRCRCCASSLSGSLNRSVHRGHLPADSAQSTGQSVQPRQLHRCPG